MEKSMARIAHHARGSRATLADIVEGIREDRQSH